MGRTPQLWLNTFGVKSQLLQGCVPPRAVDPVLVHVGHHHLEGEAGRSHFGLFFIGAVALADLKFVQLQMGYEAHVWIGTFTTAWALGWVRLAGVLLLFGEGKSRNALKELLRDLREQRDLIRIAAGN